MDNLIINGKSNSGPTFIFSHGAGAPMDHPFMEFFSKSLSSKGFKVVRFEFDYMSLRRKDGKKRPPDRVLKLMDKYLSVIKSFPNEKIFIGGKSMGGRVASLIASEYPSLIKGCICLGYPFHPPGKPENLRTEHLKKMPSKVLICQGERDVFGNNEEVKTFNLSSNIELFWLKDCDHGLKPRKSSGTTEEENWLRAINKICLWSQGLR